MSTTVQIARIDLDAIRTVDGYRCGTQLEMARTRRANVARQCWQIQDEDGDSMAVGLFVDQDVAIAFARRRGRHVAGEEGTQ